MASSVSWRSFCFVFFPLIEQRQVLTCVFEAFTACTMTKINQISCFCCHMICLGSPAAELLHFHQLVLLMFPYFLGQLWSFSDSHMSCDDASNVLVFCVKVFRVMWWSGLASVFFCVLIVTSRPLLECCLLLVCSWALHPFWCMVSLLFGPSQSRFIFLMQVRSGQSKVLFFSQNVF